MDLRRLVSLFLAALLVAVLPVLLVAGSVAAMELNAQAAAPCPHDQAPPDGPQHHDSRAGQAAAFCHQHCAPAVIPPVLQAPVSVSSRPTPGGPSFAFAPWIAGIDPPPPRWRA
jgi:hypothetical protein